MKTKGDELNGAFALMLEFCAGWLRAYLTMAFAIARWMDGLDLYLFSLFCPSVFFFFFSARFFLTVLSTAPCSCFSGLVCLLLNRFGGGRVEGFLAGPQQPWMGVCMLHSMGSKW